MCVRVSVQNEIGKGAFQELDQVKAVQQFCKYAGSASSAKDIVPTVTAALKVTPSPLHCSPPIHPCMLKLLLLCAAWLAHAACMCDSRRVTMYILEW